MKSQLQQALEACDYECRSYSGRGMYGTYCLGVEIGDITDILRLGVDVCEYLTDNDMSIDSVRSALDNAQYDNMGRGYIVYFTRVKYAEDDIEEPEED
jgi:hypothetical protein